MMCVSSVVTIRSQLEAEKEKIKLEMQHQMTVLSEQNRECVDALETAAFRQQEQELKMEALIIAHSKQLAAMTDVFQQQKDDMLNNHASASMEQSEVICAVWLPIRDMPRLF